jgi:hypothetical protein
MNQAGAHQDQAASGKAIQAEAKKNPELYVSFTESICSMAQSNGTRFFFQL